MPHKAAWLDGRLTRMRLSNWEEMGGRFPVDTWHCATDIAEGKPLKDKPMPSMATPVARCYGFCNPLNLNKQSIVQVEKETSVLATPRSNSDMNATIPLFCFLPYTIAHPRDQTQTCSYQASAAIAWTSCLDMGSMLERTTSFSCITDTSWALLWDFPAFIGPCSSSPGSHIGLNWRQSQQIQWSPKGKLYPKNHRYLGKP